MVLYHYFPWGGLQRDFARIAREVVARGHQVQALRANAGEPAGRHHHNGAVRGQSNHARMGLPQA